MVLAEFSALTGVPPLLGVHPLGRGTSLGPGYVVPAVVTTTEPSEPLLARQPLAGVAGYGLARFPLPAGPPGGWPLQFL